MSHTTTWHIYARRSKGYTQEREITLSDKDVARRFCAKLWNIPLDDVLAHAVNNCTEACDP
jgi:hypothetical protein